MRRQRRSKVKVLDLRRDVLGDKHPDTIRSMADHLQRHTMYRGGIRRMRRSTVEVLDLRRDVLGDKHPDTIQSMASLAATYHAQGRYKEAEKMYVKVRRDYS